MTENQVHTLLGDLLSPRNLPLPKPTRQDWERLREKFGCTFDEGFVHFIGLQSTHDFFIQTFTAVDLSSTNPDWNEAYGTASIDQIYDMEMQMDSGAASWNPALIPFASIGNGDVVALHSASSLASAVWYVPHDDGIGQMVSERFADWLCQFAKDFRVRAS